MLYIPVESNPTGRKHGVSVNNLNKRKSTSVATVPNPKLQSIEISASTSGHRTAFAKLEKLYYLSFNNRSDSSRKPEIILSPKSPLMKAILNGQKSPDGYIVIPLGGE